MAESGEHATKVKEPDAATARGSARDRVPAGGGAAILWAAILGTAFNLRPGAVALGPELGAVKAAMHLPDVVASLLTTLPLLCFALVGLASPWAAKTFGLHKTVVASLFLMAVGQGMRALTDSGIVFVIASVGALGGIAAANVLLPTLVKYHFPQRLGLLNAAYGISLTLGVAAAGVLTAPVADFFGSEEGWRYGLGLWGVTAAVAAIPWILVPGVNTYHSGPGGPGGTRSLTRKGGSHYELKQVARTRLGWIMAVFLGLQSLHAYAIFGWLPSIFTGAGISTVNSGLLLGLTTAVGIPLAFIFPALAARRQRPIGIMVVTGAGMLAGYLGLLLVPQTLPWLWAILLSLSTVNFPVIMTLISFRCRTAAGVSVLSGFAQGAGYLLAIPGPFLVGTFHDITGSWASPLIFLALLVPPMTIMAVLSTSPRILEDELRS